MKALVVSHQTNQIPIFVESLEPYFELTINDEKSSLQNRELFEFVFVDIDILLQEEPSSNSINFSLNKYRANYPNAHIIALSEPNKTKLAISAIKSGAEDYLNYPIDKSELIHIISKIKETNRVKKELVYLRNQHKKVALDEIMTTNNPQMQSVIKMIKSVAMTRSTVLLTGETGVGKSLMAKLIHNLSGRNDGPFIQVHCGALSESLVESELFGHEKGAFTGATQRKLGKFELAHGGTIFLDEVGTVSPHVQIKLLEVLQESKFQRVGGETDIHVNVRIIAATNENLKHLVEKHLFREDLFHRLNIFPIRIPSIRERKEDLPIIISSILKKLNRDGNKNILSLNAEALKAMTQYEWPGNIREVENILERAYILEETKMITSSSLPVEMCTNTNQEADYDPNRSLAESRKNVVENFEKQYLEDLLLRTNGNISSTAKLAGVGTRQINKMMAKYKVEKSKYTQSKKGPPTDHNTMH